jgi:geranylgeranyl diphosphate synthase type II
MAAESCGCSRSEAMPAAVAVEMVHTYSLIHDDLPAMDDDDVRRGRPTCHVAFGEAMAILAGDALLARAFEVLATGVRPASTAAACCAELAHAAGASAMVGGQAADLSAEGSLGDMVQLEHIHRRKTGAMFRVSLRLGAIIAKANDRQLNQLDLYARKLGLAFQIVDDVLDIQGDSIAAGKTSCKDSVCGKLTYPAILGIPESMARARQYVEEACSAVRDLDSSAGHLEGLARYVLERVS